MSTIRWASNTTIEVYNFNTSAWVLINTAVVGFNGIDVGVLEAAKRYFIYTITGPDVPLGYIISLSPTTPTLPVGYTFYGITGYAFTHPTLVQFLKFLIYNGSFFYEDPIEILAAGNDTTPTTIDVSALVSVEPLCPLLLSAVLTPAVASDTGLFRPNNFGNMQAYMNGQVIAVDSYAQLQLMSLDGKFDYEVANVGDSLNLKLKGFQF